MIIQRLFSIQSGGPDQGGSLKRELAARAKKGAAVGGAVGGLYGAIFSPLVGLAEGTKAGLMAGAGFIATGAISGAIANSLTVLGANKRRAKAEGLTMDKLLDYLYNRDAALSNFKDLERDIKIERYLTEDGDPNKFTVNFSYEDGKLVIYLNKPSDTLLRNLNEDLEDIIKHNRKADYAANSVKNGYMVYVICPDIDSAARIIYDVACENRINVNALTEKSLSKAKTQQKQFSSKAQKARRRKWDIQQGKDVVKTWENNFIDPSARFHNSDSPKKSNAQFKMLGEEKTRELIDEATKKNRSSKSMGGFLGVTKGPRQYIGVSNQKEAEKLKQAEDIVALGRERSRQSAGYEHALLDNNSPAYKKAKKNRNNLNDIINQGEGGTTQMEKYEYTTKDEIKRAVERSKATNPSEVKKSIAKHEKKAAELRAKKLARQKLAKNLKTAGIVGGGIAGATGIGYGIKKAIDKNKKAEREKNEKED